MAHSSIQKADSDIDFINEMALLESELPFKQHFRQHFFNGGPPTHHLMDDFRLRTRVVRQGFDDNPFIDFDSVSSKLSNVYLIE